VERSETRERMPNETPFPRIALCSIRATSGSNAEPADCFKKTQGQRQNAKTQRHQRCVFALQHGFRQSLLTGNGICCGFSVLVPLA
jgi:hypothetical protein